MNVERTAAGIVAVAQVAAVLVVCDMRVAILPVCFLLLMFGMVAVGAQGLDHPAGRGIHFLGWLGLTVPAIGLMLLLALSAGNRHGEMTPGKEAPVVVEPTPVSGSPAGSAP